MYIMKGEGLHRQAAKTKKQQISKKLILGLKYFEVVPINNIVGCQRWSAAE